MLPILRILPVGGVLLAIMIVVLALEPPGAKRPTLTSARGPLIAADEHPEWRQFLIQAAVRRADELGRLRDLPDTPTRIDGAPIPKVAGLPGSRSDSDPDDDQTGLISETPRATIPVDIGETSLFELPVAAPEQRPPEIKAPQRKAPSESRRPPPRRTTHRAKPAEQTATPFNPFATLFGWQFSQQPAAQNGSAPTMAGADPR